MPLYDYRCPKCGLEFEVSRPISKATDPAMCPLDNEASERIFTMPMTFVKGGNPDTIPAPPAANQGFGGHYHGPGGHSHGPGSHTH